MRISPRRHRREGGLERDELILWSAGVGRDTSTPAGLWRPARSNRWRSLLWVNHVTPAMSVMCPLLSPTAVELVRCSETTRSAMCGRRPVGKGFLHVCSGSVQPCVRPTCAVLMTAGHNALRESGPGQNPAFEHAMAHVGCPDRRIDRHCITCCSPSQLQVTPLCRRDFGYAASAAGSL